MFCLLLITGCVSPISLEGVEVSEYQGEDLSSINDFRENSIKGPQYVNINDFELSVFGLVSEPVNYSYDQVLANQPYTKVVTLHCVEGWSVNILWEGVLISDLIDPLPGANTVIFHAVDGYTSSLPLDYVLDNNILLAYSMNNVTLPSERGFPFQVVAEDKWGYKWVKWVTGIELGDNPDYRGFWESRGYNNVGNVNESRFG